MGIWFGFVQSVRLSQTRYTERYMNAWCSQGEKNRREDAQRKRRGKGSEEKKKDTLKEGESGDTSRKSIPCTHRWTLPYKNSNKQLRLMCLCAFLQGPCNLHSHFSWQFVVLVTSTLMLIFSTEPLLWMEKKWHTVKATVNVLTL